MIEFSRRLQEFRTPRIRRLSEFIPSKRDHRRAQGLRQL